MRLFLYSIYCVFVVLIGFLLGEGAVRLLGHKPYAPLPADIRVEPGGRFYTSHPTLGFAHLPGAFTVTLNNSYQFQVTHLSDSLRATHPPAAHSKLPKEEIWIFGCSFTHGWGLNDRETYAWVLQEKLPAYEVVNFGVGGYGAIHGLIQFKEALAQGRAPKVAVVAYGSFHNTRNIASRLYRKALIPHSRLGDLYLPCARLDSQGRLQYANIKLGYAELPLMRSSALLHRLEELYHKQEGKFYQSEKVSRAIIAEFQRLCRERQVILVVAGLKNDRKTAEMLAYCREQGIVAGDIAVDLNLPENTNLPHDTHPSARANREYADRLEKIMRQVLP